MEDWSDLFEPEALKKGYELFLNEAVEPFEVIDDGYGFRLLLGERCRGCRH